MPACCTRCPLPATPGTGRLCDACRAKPSKAPKKPFSARPFRADLAGLPPAAVPLAPPEPDSLEACLGRLMATVEGPDSLARRILCGGEGRGPRILYAARVHVPYPACLKGSRS